MTDSNLGLNPNIQVTRDTPPTFLLQAEDDHEDSLYDSLSYYIALAKAGVPVEMRLYAHGGHAFGLRPTKSRSRDGLSSWRSGWEQLGWCRSS